MSWKDDLNKITAAGETFARKAMDDSLKHNAENASGAGLEVRVTRIYDGVGLSNGRRCEWCLERCGEDMPYQEAYQKGAFERHEGCGCIIEYVSKKGEKTYQTGKSSPDNWLSEKEFQKRVNYGLDNHTPSPLERIINAAIEMQARDKKSLTLVNAIVEHHEALKNYTPDAMKQRLEEAGFAVESLAKSKSGFNALPFEEGGGYIVHFGDDGVLQYHPSGGIHSIAYWKINNGRRGKHWYDTTGREHFFGKKY